MKLNKSELSLITSIINNSDVIRIQEMRIIFILIESQSLTQRQIADRLNIKYAQNITKSIKLLMQYNFVVVDRVEGKNKYLKLNDKFTENATVLKGQLSF